MQYNIIASSWKGEEYFLLALGVHLIILDVLLPPCQDIPTSSVAREKINAKKAELDMFGHGFIPRSAVASYPEQLTKREAEGADICAASIIKQGFDMHQCCADVSKSGYRVPISSDDSLPTLTTRSKIYHLGKNRMVSPYVQLAS
jgi:hypothetical protein